LWQPACRNNDTIHVDDLFAPNETKNFPSPLPQCLVIS